MSSFVFPLPSTRHSTLWVPKACLNEGGALGFLGNKKYISHFTFSTISKLGVSVAKEKFYD